MATHVWEIEYITDPWSGDDSGFWKCLGCGLSAGPALGGKLAGRRWSPFLAGEPMRVTYSEDCDEAKRQIAELKASPEWLANTRARRVNDALGILSNLSPRVGGKVERKTCRVNGGDGKRKFVVELLGIEGPWRLTLKSEGVTKEFAEVFDVIEHLRVYFNIPRRFGCYAD